VLFTLALRVPTVGEPAYPDEGGYLLAAAQWHGDGPMLYGYLFVDRPPLLMVFWWIAVALGGLEAARWLGCLLVVVLVICAGVAGRLVGGDRGAVWAALTAAALGATPAISAQEVDGELLAVPFLMTSCTCILVALRRPMRRAQAGWAAAAGLLGIGAVLVKQNFIDALVFAAVIVVASAATGRLPRDSAVRVLGWCTAGAAAGLTAAGVWAMTTPPGLSGLWYAMYGFRTEATRVILEYPLDAPLSRLGLLLLAALVSGIAAILILFAVASRRRLRSDPVALAIMAMLTVGLIGIAAGASYWAHYLVGLIPALALAVGSLGDRSVRVRRATSAVVALTVASALAGVALADHRIPASRPVEAALAQWLAASAHESDTAVITYGHASVIAEAGLRPAYRYIWSLPMRTLDPDLEVLTETLRGPTAPTWVVQYEGFNTWQMDPDGQLADTVAEHYRQVTSICGVEVFLRRGVTRPLPAAPPPDACIA